MSNSLRNTLLTPLNLLASPALMFFALPWLMLILVLGTVAQRYIGLYASQKLFFGSYVLWAGLVPLPGAYSVLALIAASLVAKLALKSPLRREQTGTIIIHVSAIILLLGGLITAWLREDGYIVLGDGDSTRVVSDYRERTLTFEREGKPVSSLPYAALRAGDVPDMRGLPFSIHVLHVCFPCTAQPRSSLSTDLRGVARKVELVTVPYSKEDAKNIGGVEFSVTGAGAEADGTYIAFEGLANPETIATKNATYQFALRPKLRPLPFTVKLVHFTKSLYPGTDEARAYKSDVTVADNGIEWNATIEMNQPLRYKGYTFYQSSFVDDGNREMTVLAVVKNAGEWCPYIAVSLLCAGLAVHMMIMLRAKAAA